MTGFTRRASTDVDTQPVAIVSVDATARRATGLSRSRTEINIYTDYAVGGTYVTPAIGDQWQVTRIDGQWRLDHKIPFNDSVITDIAPVEGQHIVGSGNGPLELSGTVVNIRPNTFTLGGIEYQIGVNGLQKNTGTADAPVWTTLNPPVDPGFAPVQSVNGQTGDVTLTAASVGLGNVDNTPDETKPVSAAVAAALGSKADLTGGVLPTAQLPPLTPTNITGLPAQLTALNTSTTANTFNFQSFLDAITGKPTGTGTVAAVSTRLSALDYTGGTVDASKLSNLSATPVGIPQNSISGLLTSLGNLLSVSYWQNFLDTITGKSTGTGTTAALNTRLSALDFNTGAPDASKLSNISSIPSGIPSTAISGLTSSLNALLPISTYQSLVDALANSLGHSGTGHTWTDIETYFGIIPPANVGAVLGGSNLAGDLTSVNTTATGAQSAATTAQTTANTANTQAARKAQNDAILGDWLHSTYPLGSATDTAATLVGGKRTWWGAWNDNLLLLGQMLGITPPTTPASDVGTAVSTAQSAATAAQTTANSASTAAGTAQTTANTANTAAGTAQTAATTAQTTANTNATRASRKAQNDLILGDWLHATYPLGSITDTAATLVGGKRTWWGAWNDNLTLLGQMLGIAAPTDPASDVGAAVVTAQGTANSANSAASAAQTTANSASTAASTAQSTLNTTNTNLFGSTTPGTAIQQAAVPTGIPATKVSNVLGGSNLGADVSAVSSAASSANTAAGTAQTTANTANTRASRKAQNDLIINDWLHATYPLGTSSDTAATLVGGKRTWWGAWNDNLTLLGQMLGITAPTDPASDVNAAITTAQSTANTGVTNAATAQSAANTVQSTLNTTNTNLFGSTTPGTAIQTAAVPTGIPATKIANVLGGSSLAADVSAVNSSASAANTAAGTAQTTANTANTAAGTAQTTANTNATRVARKAQNDLILGDWLHTTYPLGSATDTAATLVGGKRTWWGAWNDNLTLLGILLGITAPTDPASDVNAAITTAQSTANSANSAASAAQSTANTNVTNIQAANNVLFGTPSVGTAVLPAALPNIVAGSGPGQSSDIQLVADQINQATSGGSATGTPISGIAQNLLALPQQNIAVDYAAGATSIAVDTATQQVASGATITMATATPHTWTINHTPLDPNANYLMVALNCTITHAMGALTPTAFVTGTGQTLAPSILFTGAYTLTGNGQIVIGVPIPPGIAGTGNSVQVTFGFQNNSGGTQTISTVSIQSLSVIGWNSTSIVLQSPDGQNSNPSQSIPSIITGELVVNMMTINWSTSPALSAYSQTTQENSGVINGTGVKQASILGTSLNTGTVTFSATSAATNNLWNSLIFILKPSPGALVGSGIRQYRSLGTASGGTGFNLFPAGFFDTTRTGQKTSDLAVSNNAVTITLAGWYMVEIRVVLSAFQASLGMVTLSPVLYKNGAVEHCMPGISAAFNVVGAQDFTSHMGGCGFVYCNIGDILQPGYLVDGAGTLSTLTFTGGQTQTHWSVALVNRSLL